MTWNRVAPVGQEVGLAAAVADDVEVVERVVVVADRGRLSVTVVSLLIAQWFHPGRGDQHGQGSCQIIGTRRGQL